LGETARVSYLGEQLALLLTPAANFRRIAERQNSQHLQLIGDANSALTPVKPK